MESITSSPGSLLKSSRYTMAALTARGLDHQREEIETLHDALLEANARFLQADDERIDAQADNDQVEMRVRDAINDLQLETTVVTRRDRGDPIYRGLFPKGLSAIKRLQGEALQMELSRVIGLLKELPQSHPLAAHLKNIQAVQAAWVKPAQALEAAIVKRAVAESALNEAKQAWLDGYDALRGALQKEFPRRRVFVRSFFPKRAKRKAAAKPGPTPTPAKAA